MQIDDNTRMIIISSLAVIDQTHAFIQSLTVTWLVSVLGAISGLFPASVTNPMDKITKSQIKIIDFNHSRMFTLDDSPFIRRKETFSKRKKSLTEDELWQQMID